MGHISFIYIITLLFTAISCSSSGEKTTKKDYHDSLGQSTIAQDTMPEITPIPPGPPPNTVRIRAKALGITSSDNNKKNLLKLTVIEVLGIGSATPVVTAYDTLTVKTGQLPVFVKKGSIFIGSLKHHQVLDPFKDTIPAWRLASVEHNDD